MERKFDVASEIAARYGTRFLSSKRITDIAEGPIPSSQATLKSCEHFACITTDVLMLLIEICDAADCLSSVSLHGTSGESHLHEGSESFKAKLPILPILPH